jgi:hypothetical protein
MHAGLAPNRSPVHSLVDKSLIARRCLAGKMKPPKNCLQEDD